MPTPQPLQGRGSLRSRIAARLSAMTLRQLSAVLPPEQPWGLWASRRIVAGVMDTFGPSLAGVTVESIDHTLPDGRRVLGEWITTGPPMDSGPHMGPSSHTCSSLTASDSGRHMGPSSHTCSSLTASDSGRAIYYLHGSGYAVCSARTHRRLAGWMSALTQLPVFCLDYRLAPRHRFPSAADDAHAGWDWLLKVRGLSPENIVVAGDSAGGHLAVDLLLHHNRVRPAAMLLFSPLVDLTFTLARGREQLRPDPAIRSSDAARLVAMYWQGLDIAHPRITHDLAGCTDLPPLLIQAGGTEMLAADAHHLAEAWQAAGGDCTLQIWPDQVHVFQALPRLTPEAGAAMSDAVAFIRNALSCNTINTIAG